MPQSNDPIERYLEEQHALDEQDLLEGLRFDSERRMRELKSQVPDGRHDLKVGEPLPRAAGEMWLLGGPETPDQGGFGLV